MKPYLQLAQEAARAAGRRLLELRGQAVVSHKDTTQNLVTQADVESEEIITHLISTRFPGHRFLLEEGASTGGAEAEHLWIVDPLDATNNYAHGIPHFSVSIAYAEAGVVQVGAVFDPVRDEMFTAVRGRGAVLNGQPLRVSSHARLQECIVATGFFYDRGRMMEKTLASIGRLFSLNIRGIRRMGSAALDLSWVASGRFDGFFEYKLAPWDYAAGSLIVEEAGGRCADRSGQPFALASGSVIAANALVFDSIVEAVRWSGEDC
jgi:myo-inositol-1(or 4)-monophosphatase